MSADTPSESPTVSSPNAGGKPRSQRTSVKVHQHTMLLYYWPIWFFGLLFAGLTLLDNHRLALLPSDGKKWVATDLTVKESRLSDSTKTIKSEQGIDVLLSEKHPADGIEYTDRIVARNPFFGVIYLTLILLVIFFTNVPLRGLTATLFLAAIVIFFLLLYSFGQLRQLAEKVLMLDVRINLAGYVMLSVCMFILWGIAFWLVDHRIYIEFLPGQIKVVTEVGEGETTYDSAGVEFLIQPTDPFRNHLLGLAWLGWLLKATRLVRNEEWGLGTGDLIVTTGGKQIQISNVIGLTEKRKAITEMLKKQRVVSDSSS
jgi:hypothetical protein